MSKHALQHNYLTIPLPSDWEDASEVIALGLEQNGFRPNLIFSQEPILPGETPETFASRQLPQLKMALDEYVVVKEGLATFGPNSGYLRHHTFSVDRGEIGQLQFYCVIDRRAYTFTFTHRKQSLEDVRPVAERMFAEARITPYLPDLDDDDDF